MKTFMLYKFASGVKLNVNYLIHLMTIAKKILAMAN